MKKVILVLVFPVLALGADTINFGSDTPGTVPKGRSANMTHQGGAPKWEVVADKTAPSKKPYVVEPGARTMALDLKTHKIFLPLADLGPAPPATAENPRPRGSILPGTFRVLIFGM
jgi:hypothetical protein